MTYTPRQPKNLNAIQSVHFKFQIKRSPEIEYFIQKAPIPGMALGYEMVPNPFVFIPKPGDHLDFNELDIVFRVDEELANYLCIHNWMRALGKPENFKEYAKIEAVPMWTGEGIYSDLSLSLLSAKQNAIFECVFEDAFPVGLSNLDFDTTQSDLTYLKASARFMYRDYKFKQTI